MQRWLSQEKFLLLAIDALQLDHICLEERDAKGEVDAHDPEFRGARKIAINSVGKEDLDKVHMKSAGGSNS